MAIDPNKDADSNEKNSETSQVKDAAPQAKKPRATINVHNSLGRSIMLHLHEAIDQPGSHGTFQGRLLTSIDDPDAMPQQIQLDDKYNAGVDKEFFDKWQAQNKGSNLKDFLTAEDEKEPESAKREEHD